MRNFFLAISIAVLLILGIFVVNYFDTFRVIASIKSTNHEVKNEKIRILLVPGHEPDYGGTEFKNIKERDLVVKFANEIKSLFQGNGNFEVYVTRDEKKWNSDIESYFQSGWDLIISWEKAKRALEDLAIISTSTISYKYTTKKVVKHINVPKGVAVRLYGITKWANENDMDLILHLHLDDDPYHRKNRAGKYSGFTIYVPVQEFSNGQKSREIAEYLKKEFIKENSVNNFIKGIDGIVSDSGLIAIGASNTAEAPSILIEYGFIYEPKFASDDLREETIKRLSLATYTAVTKYYGLSR